MLGMTEMQRCKQVIFCKSKSSPKSMLGVASQVKSSHNLFSSQVVKSQPSASHVKSLVFGVNSSHTRLLHVMYLYFNVQFYCLFIVTQLWFLRGNFYHFVRFERIFKGLNWFYYILSKAPDLRCQQVIFSKSKSSPKPWIASPSQVLSQSGKLQVKSQKRRLESDSSPSHLTRVYISAEMRTLLSVCRKIHAWLQTGMVKRWCACRDALWRHVHSQIGIKFSSKHHVNLSKGKTSIHRIL